MSESQFAGCHGVRVEPASQGAAFGVTSGSPLAMLALGEGPDPGAALVLQLVSTYAAPLAAQRVGAFVLHAAAAAVRDGRALVVCAHSGTGKSSVATTSSLAPEDGAGPRGGLGR